MSDLTKEKLLGYVKDLFNIPYHPPLIPLGGKYYFDQDGYEKHLLNNSMINLEKLQQLRDYFYSTRGVGHTNAARKGVDNLSNARLLVLRKITRNEKEVALSQTERLRGTKSPLVLDNGVVVQILDYVINKLSPEFTEEQINNWIDDNYEWLKTRIDINTLIGSTRFSQSFLQRFSIDDKNIKSKVYKEIIKYGVFGKSSIREDSLGTIKRTIDGFHTLVGRLPEQGDNFIIRVSNYNDNFDYKHNIVSYSFYIEPIEVIYLSK